MRAKSAGNTYFEKLLDFEQTKLKRVGFLIMKVKAAGFSIFNSEFEIQLNLCRNQ